MHTYSHSRRSYAFGGPNRIELFHSGLHFQSALCGLSNLMGGGEFNRDPKENHHGIADKLVERATVFENNLDHGVKVLVEKPGQCGGRYFVGESGEALEVGEQNRTHKGSRLFVNADLAAYYLVNEVLRQITFHDIFSEVLIQVCNLSLTFFELQQVPNKANNF